MRIANPMYSVVFRYLLEDLAVARLMLSTLLEKEILQLDIMHSEVREGNSKKKPAKPLKDEIEPTYLYFFATIKNTDGFQKQVMIELQKARFKDTVQKFSYAFLYLEDLPVYTIYFLGFPLDEYRETPILKVERRIRDKQTKKGYDNEKICSFFHENLLIIVPHLKDKYRDQAEKMLHIFEEKPKSHFLEIHLDDYPEELRPIVYRLEEAATNEQIKKQMETEDEILEKIRQKFSY